MIEGIPDGWELVRVGPVKYGEWRLMESGKVMKWTTSLPSIGWAVVLRKTEKPKQYRPFANAAEFLAHPLSGDFIDVGAGEFAKVEHCNDDGIWIGSEEIEFYADAYHAYRFRDKSPFGVEVQS